MRKKAVHVKSAVNELSQNVDFFLVKVGQKTKKLAVFFVQKVAIELQPNEDLIPNFLDYGDNTCYWVRDEDF